MEKNKLLAKMDFLQDSCKSMQSLQKLCKSLCLLQDLAGQGISGNIVTKIVQINYLKESYIESNSLLQSGADPKVFEILTNQFGAKTLKRENAQRFTKHPNFSSKEKDSGTSRSLASNCTH